MLAFVCLHNRRGDPTDKIREARHSQKSFHARNHFCIVLSGGLYLQWRPRYFWLNKIQDRLLHGGGDY